MTWQATAERFYAKVQPSNDGADCWLWTGATDPTGYGRFATEGRVALAHRVAWELMVGPIPEGMQIDHLCRRRECVNHQHLEPVPQRLNILRGSAPNARAIQTGRCKRDHDLADAYITPSGKRDCRICKAMRRRAAYDRRKAARAA